jgi:hypothetical protein
VAAATEPNCISTADHKKFEKHCSSGKVLTLCKTTVQVKGE